MLHFKLLFLFILCDPCMWMTKISISMKSLLHQRILAKETWEYCISDLMFNVWGSLPFDLNYDICIRNLVISADLFRFYYVLFPFLLFFPPLLQLFILTVMLCCLYAHTKKSLLDFKFLTYEVVLKNRNFTIYLPFKVKKK